ncbi:MAG: hypothetical protein M9914_02800 [Trueperaceae bacterium]|nr:hypothetical protein [Trueperaceae bacterium]
MLEEYGAFDISLACDVPLFVDPFLLFNIKEQGYRDQHDGIIRLLLFRDRAAPGIAASPGSATDRLTGGSDLPEPGSVPATGDGLVRGAERGVAIGQEVLGYGTARQRRSFNPDQP